MRNTMLSLSFALLLVVLAGCETEPYYTGDAPTITDISPTSERSLTGCSHVVIEVADLGECATPAVVFGNRNAIVLPSDGVESDADVDYWEARCHLSDPIDIDDDAINVISPPGPVAGGEVDVQIACSGGIGVEEDGYEYADGRHTPDGFDLHENEVSGIAVFWQDGPFVNVPFIYGYGFVHEQPVPRQSIYLAGDHDAVATRDGVRPQSPPALFDLPEGSNRLRIGDTIDFYYERHLQNDPVAQYVGSTTSIQNEQIAFLGVYYERPPGEACYAGDEAEQGGYYWGSGDSTDTAAKGCIRYYKIHPNLLQGADAQGNDLEPNELPLDFDWAYVLLPLNAPPYETRDGVDQGNPDNVGVELPTGNYYAYLVRANESFGLPMDPYDPLEVELEYFPNLYIEQGSTIVTLPEETVFALSFDTDVRYYDNTDTGGENVFPMGKEMFVRAAGGSSYGSAVAEFDTDLNGNMEYDAGEYVVTVPPTEDEDSVTGFTAALGLYESFPLLIDRSQYEGLEMDDSDWEAFVDDGFNEACTGLSILWTSDCDGEDGDIDSCFDGADNDGDDLLDMDDDECFCARDFVTATLEVWDFGVPYNGMGYTTTYRLVARAWDSEGRICFPPEALAALPDISPSIGGDGPEFYPYSSFGNFNINKHRMNRIPIDELYGNMVVDVAHIYGSYFFTVSNCEDGFDNDGDGLIDAADLGCDQDDPSDFWELGGECDDGEDNDGDGLIDLDDAEDCSSGSDPCEGTCSACDDGHDNDGDGWIDYADDNPDTEGIDESLWGDPGCEDEDDNNEDNADLGECADGDDNDNDGLVDGADPECSDPAGMGYLSQHEAPQCSDGEDNDGDGFTDLDDPECEDELDNQEAPTGCEDGIDNDEDGWVDADDPDCYYYGNVTETGLYVMSWACGDGVDNDNDGLIDGFDPDCLNAEYGSEEAADPTCSDGVDNDADGWFDLDDPDCQSIGGTEDPGGFYGSQCNDDLDNDGDGLTDAADPNCDDAYDDDEQALGCEDGLDNDGDGWIDADDPDCFYYGSTDEFGLDVNGWECGDGDDNDADGLIDGNDPDCTDAENGTESSPDPTCVDGTDDDGDGWIDAADPDCAVVGDAEDGGASGGTECNDGADNDADGLTDADDPECDDAYDDQEAGDQCIDGVDNDGDGWIDADDPDCYLYGGPLESGQTIVAECGNGQDDDGDGLIDGNDPDCTSASDSDESQ